MTKSTKLHVHPKDLDQPSLTQSDQTLLGSLRGVKDPVPILLYVDSKDCDQTDAG